MPPVVIENPILNSPLHERGRDLRFDDDAITADLLPGRRPSRDFVPIAAPRKKSKPLTLDSLLETERKVEADGINRIRARVETRRELGRPDVTATTRGLLQHWTDPTRSRRLFFCQVKALETLIFIAKVDEQSKYGQAWIDESLRAAAAAGTGLFRLACEMATGSGKAVVMAKVVAWQTLNKRRSPKDARFADAFLVVAPGVTIRDRLRVLFPAEPSNYYRDLDLGPPSGGPTSAPRASSSRTSTPSSASRPATPAG